MALCRVEDIAALNNHDLVVTSWLLAAGLGVVLWMGGRLASRAGNAWRAAGLAIMWIPVWQILLAAGPELAKTFCAEGNVGSFLPGAPGPAPLADLSHQFIRHLMTLTFLAVGALLWLQGERPGWWRKPTTRLMAAALERILPMGRGEMVSLRMGIALFPVLAAVNLVLVALTGLSVVYHDNTTLYHAVMLSLAAGFGEELLYRGVLQQGIRRVLSGIGVRPGWLAAALAIILQAIPFAYAHEGYGDLTLLGFALAFALAAGLLVELFGLWTAIALHVLINFYKFAMTPAGNPTLFAVAILAALPILVIAAAEYRRVWRAVRQHFAS